MSQISAGPGAVLRLCYRPVSDSFPNTNRRWQYAHIRGEIAAFGPDRRPAISLQRFYRSFTEAACVLSMMLSEGEVLVIVVITAAIVFVIARRMK